jgi:hypothetical protein
MEPLPSQVTAVMELKAFLGMANFYHRFLPGHSLTLCVGVPRGVPAW